MEEILGERAGQLRVEKIGDNISLKLWYDTKSEYTIPHQQMYLFPEELDKLCAWWDRERPYPVNKKRE